MYEARIQRQHTSDVSVGPTDTRDEASRLARSWIEANPHHGQSDFGRVYRVQIVRVDEDADGNDE